LDSSRRECKLIIKRKRAVAKWNEWTMEERRNYLDDHVEPFAHITRYLKQHGAIPGMQLAHAGRKASARMPWEGGNHLEASEGGWEIIAPSAVAFGGKLPRIPQEMTLGDSVSSGDVCRCPQSLAGTLAAHRSPLGDGTPGRTPR
jgi:2,4-dienoyl-CoA reductase-like NADH-dependent reductase (Old Yellow Enzyme family)